MSDQLDRCDRTAYVSGLQPTLSDLELFEVFNRVAHVEKVILRSGAVRHALVVFKSVQGLYMVLIHFQGARLHGRQIHIRPLRESSHNATNSSNQPFVTPPTDYGYRHAPESYPFSPDTLPTYFPAFQGYSDSSRRFRFDHLVRPDHHKSPPDWKMELQIKKQEAADQNQLQKPRPNLSVVNPSLFNDPRSSEEPRDMTNDELSDLIVSTGNLRVESSVSSPAPWSPVNRTREGFQKRAFSSRNQQNKFQFPTTHPLCRHSPLQMSDELVSPGGKVCSPDEPMYDNF